MSPTRLGPRQATLAEFSADLDRIVVKLDHRVERFLRAVAMEVARNIIVGGLYSPGSPVDTGFFRGSWRAGINEWPAPTSGKPYDGEQLSFDFGGAAKESAPSTLAPDAMNELLAVLATASVGDTIYLSNTTVYGVSLEYGHSQQAPAGFVRVTVAAFLSIVNDVLAVQMAQEGVPDVS